jgi:hypothetical protein
MRAELSRLRDCASVAFERYTAQTSDWVDDEPHSSEARAR